MRRRRLPFALQNPAAALDSERRERVRVSPAARRERPQEESGPSPLLFREPPAALTRPPLRSPAKHHRDRGMPSKEGCGCWPTRGSFGWLLLLRICIAE